MALFAAVSFAGPVHAADLDINNLPQVADSKLAASVSDLRVTVQDIRVPEPTDVTTEHGRCREGTTLNSDILFSFDKAAITPAAATKVGELVKALPQGAKVAVGGHTDSLGTDARNLTLSQERATAVAAAIKAGAPTSSSPSRVSARPSQSRPTALRRRTTRRVGQNRRVEIRFAG